jgi:hypothetical protein
VTSAQSVLYAAASEVTIERVPCPRFRYLGCHCSHRAVIALPAGALTAAPAGVRQDRQRICLGNAPSPRLGQFRVEPVPDVAFQVQRKVNGAKEVMLKFPRALPDYLADIGVLRHPRRQQLLAISECLATSRAT